MSELNLSPDVDEELGYVFDAINLTRSKIDGRVPLIGFSGAPFTLMGYMIEGGGSKTLSKAKTWLYQYPQACHKLLQALTDTVVIYLIKQVEAGAQLLQVFESNGGDLTPEHWETFCLPYLRQIATGVKKGLKERGLSAPMTVFSRGSNQAGALVRYTLVLIYEGILI